jgi:cyclic-di-AMP phosphodiesterase PgpH
MKLPGNTAAFSRFIDRFRDQGFRRNTLLRALIGAGLFAAIILMIPHPESTEYSYSVGTVWVDKDLMAPFSFPIYKDAREYEKALADAIKSVYPVFTPHEEVAHAVSDSLHLLLKNLQECARLGSVMMRSNLRQDSSAYHRALAGLGLTVPSGLWNKIIRWPEDGKGGGKRGFKAVEQAASDVAGTLLKTGIINQPKRQQPGARFALRQGTSEDLVPYDHVRDMDGALNEASSRLMSVSGEDEQMLALEVVRSVLRPNIIFDQLATSRALRIAEDNVPRTDGYVQENERIVARNELITDEIRQKLDSFRRARSDRGSNYSVWKHWVGSGLHIVLVLLLYTIYLVLFRKPIVRDNSKLFLIAVVILMGMVFARASLLFDVPEPLQYLIAVPAASMLLSIIFDSRVAFFGTVTIALLTAGIRGNDYSIALSSLIAGTMAAYSVRDISNRTQIFRSIGFIFGGYAVSIIALSLEQFEPLPVIGTKIMFALLNAVVSPVLTYGLLLFFEKVFNVTTDLRLVDLADFNQPLLRKLSEQAPGTFHHSVTIGNLAEAAAEAVGANANLARVGGYYHDIGKMNKPEYFVENQVGPHSRHNRLKPRMSALIISSHVREGLELGREYGLPEVVLDFIPQHHGTTRMSFFFDKALKQAAKRPTKEGISEQDFRYPGPKPQTKEAGIVMLADSVEASTRAMSDMTPQLLEQVIENMIRHRFIEGQLDECELTLRDLTKTREAFLKILIGIHHQRLTYPEQEENAAATAEPSAVQAAEPAPPAVVPGSVFPEAVAEPAVPAESELPQAEPPASEIPGEAGPAPDATAGET